MKISIITPTHNPRFLPDLYESIKNQTYTDWEWIIVPNGEALNSDIMAYFGNSTEVNKKIKIVHYKEQTEHIGKIKYFAFMQGSGDVLLECDHDDLLTPTALQECADAFKDPNIVFAYSNTANFKDGTWEPEPDYNPAYGWQYREQEIDGHKFREALTFEPSPASICLIYYAPNHFRAWRKDFYHKIGGHNPEFRVADDHELLIRTHLKAPWGMKHIDKLCYLYRVYGENAWLKFNQEIQTKTWELYNQYIYQLVEKWCDIHSYPMIDLGGRFNCPKEYDSVDIKDADIKADLRKKWPFKDNSIGLIRAHDALEHFPDKQFTMSEIYRVLMPGGWLLSQTPSTDGRGAWQDPTHCSFWNQNSFYYYTRKEQANYIDNTKIRFSAFKLTTEFLNDWCRQNNIPYVVAHLVKLTDDMGRFPGLKEI